MFSLMYYRNPYLKDKTMGSVYLGPPLMSDHDYNVLFAEQDGSHWVHKEA